MSPPSSTRDGTEAEVATNTTSSYQDIVSEIALQALTTTELDTLFERTIGLVIRTLDLDGCGVFDRSSNGYRFRTGSGWDPAPTGEVALDFATGHGQHLVWGDSGSREAPPAPESWKEIGVRSAIATSLGPDTPSGALVAFSRTPRRFDSDAIAFVGGVSYALGQAILLRQDDALHDASRALLRALAHHMPALVWTTDQELCIRHAFGSELLRFASLERFLGKTLYEVFDTEYLNFPPIVAHRSALRGRVARYHYRLAGLRLEVQVEPLRDRRGEIVGTVGVATDVSTRDRVEEKIRLLSTALECAANAILITDREGAITWVNPAFTELTGYAPEDVIGHNPRILKSNAHEPEFYQTLWRTILSGRVWSGEVVNRRKDGSLFTELQTITPVSDADGQITHFISFRQDITEAKELEEQFRQSQKMEAIGRLAGGVAHDFNNLLTAIIGYSDLLLIDLHRDDPRHSDLVAIKSAAERASSLTRHLLAFSRRQVLQPKVLDLNHTVANMSKMLRRLIGEDIDLVTILDESLGRTKADPGQIEQVILNLAVNARDAMPHGGKLTIETTNVELDEAYYQRHPVVQPGPYVLLVVSDTGTGMDKNVLSHIFEPFFTTKEAGKGTGLGLSTVYGIVKQSGGYIWAYSEPGLGTTFRLYLPRIDQPDETLTEDKTIPTPYGSETILLIEDEDVVRRLARRILEAYGYRVLEARNGAEALVTSQQYKGTIHLMLTDVVMPLMGGQEVARRQLPLRPEMKVLYMSGYTDEAISRHGILEPGTILLQKPFSKSTLLQKVRKVLDGTSTPGAS